MPMNKKTNWRKINANNIRDFNSHRMVDLWGGIFYMVHQAFKKFY